MSYQENRFWYANHINQKHTLNYSRKSVSLSHQSVFVENVAVYFASLAASKMWEVFLWFGIVLWHRRHDFVEKVPRKHVLLLFVVLVGHFTWVKFTWPCQKQTDWNSFKHETVFTVNWISMEVSLQIIPSYRIALLEIFSRYYLQFILLLFSLCFFSSFVEQWWKSIQFIFLVNIFNYFPRICSEQFYFSSSYNNSI